MTNRRVTRDSVRQAAAARADDPSTVTEIVHTGFNSDLASGGFAFRHDRGVLIQGFSRGEMWSVDPGSDEARVALVERFWREAQHRDRQLELSDVSAWHRAAVAAVARGVRSVGELPLTSRAGVDDIARADYLLVFLRRHSKAATQEAALRALAANDGLLELPKATDRAHPCPLCGHPAIGEPWQYVSVCDDCYPMTTCEHDRQVSGYNTSISGGFEAQHVDDGSVCDQVTRDGRVWVFERECVMGEAKFGGVFVGAHRGNWTDKRT